MYPEHPAWVEHQRKRWMRPDAERYWRPDAARFMTPEEVRLFLPESMRPAERKDEPAPMPPHISPAQQAREERQELLELLRLKSDIAWLRFQRALVLHMIALQRKANFNPSQPRVPAGNPDGGQWTSEGEGAGKIQPDAPHGANEGPQDNLSTVGQGNSPPDVPKKRPSTSQERTRVIRRLGRWGGKLGPIVAAARWLRNHVAEIRSYRDPPKTLKELQAGVRELPKPGYEKHHNVERGTVENAKRFPQSQLEGPDNIVAIPKQKHREIGEWYSTKIYDDKFGGRTPRDYLRGKDWDEQYQFGLEVLRKFGVLK